jgi:hypothetical protein
LVRSYCIGTFGVVGGIRLLWGRYERHTLKKEAGDGVIFLANRFLNNLIELFYVVIIIIIVSKREQSW